MSEEETRHVFTLFDPNRSGGLDVAELRSALAMLGLSADGPQAAALLAKYDTHRSRVLELREFHTLARELRQFHHHVAVSGGAGGSSSSAAVDAEWASSVDHAFALADAGTSGVLDVYDLTVALRALGLEAPRSTTLEMMARFDVDHDERIDVHEFRDLAREMRRFQQADERARLHFRTYDRDSDGFIELPGALAALDLDTNSMANPAQVRDFLQLHGYGPR